MTDREERFEDLAQLPGGQWYAKRLLISGRLSGGENKGKPWSTEEAFDVKAMTSEEVPSGTFDGEKLLEGAKVETY